MRLARWLLVVALAFGCALPALLPSELRAAPAASLEAATEAWDSLLKHHVRPNGGVDYAGFAADAAKLKAFVAAHAQLSLANASDDDKKAAYINLYNAGMIVNVLTYAKEQGLTPGSDAFARLKIDELKVPGGNLWNGSYTFLLAGKAVTLDDIEHHLLRGQEGGPLAAASQVRELDPRLHAAVNCAAVSCPRLRPEAYRGATLNHTLEAAMREFVSDDRQFHLAADDPDQLTANSIILWYYDDFDRYGKAHGTAGAGSYLAGFVSSDSPEAAAKKRFFAAHLNDRSRLGLRLAPGLAFSYQWNVNDLRNKP